MESSIPGIDDSMVWSIWRERVGHAGHAKRTGTKPGVPPFKHARLSKRPGAYNSW